MKLNIKKLDYMDNWYTVSGYDTRGRHIAGSGRTASEAINDALTEYLKYAHKI